VVFDPFNGALARILDARKLFTCILILKHLELRQFLVVKMVKKGGCDEE